MVVEVGNGAGHNLLDDAGRSWGQSLWMWLCTVVMKGERCFLITVGEGRTFFARACELEACERPAAVQTWQGCEVGEVGGFQPQCLIFYAASF